MTITFVQTIGATKPRATANTPSPDRFTARTTMPAPSKMYASAQPAKVRRKTATMEMHARKTYARRKVVATTRPRAARAMTETRVQLATPAKVVSARERSKHATTIIFARRTVAAM